MHHCSINLLELAQDQRHRMQQSNADVFFISTKTYTVFSFIYMA